jgi:hypothetical protein
MGSFTFNGKTVVAPSILVKTVIGQNTALSLLPFGTLCFVGASDGGHAGGTVYRFTDIVTAQRVLRSGALYDALELAAQLGGASGFIACVIGTKTSASATLDGASTAAATITAGDQGTWTNDISFEVSAGTTSSTFAVTFQYPDPVTGNTITQGGIGTPFDNLTTLAELQAAILANAVLTPPASTGLVPVVTMTITTAGNLADQAVTFLSGGTGDGSYVPELSDVMAGMNALEETAFDIGHLVGVYDAPSQEYADSKSQTHEVLGMLRRFIHQAPVTGTSPAYTKQVNSEAVANSGIARANALSYYRSNVCAQQLYVYNQRTGNYQWADAAIIACGLACIVGATDQWGPASPLTRVSIPTVANIDYSVLRTTGDLDAAVAQGVMLFEVVGLPQLGAVRCVQSVTTQPNNPQTGQPWILGEFSGVRAADALLSNVKGVIDSMQPRAVGGGNTVGTMNSILAAVVGVIELALDYGWLTGYDKNSISINTTGPTGEDDLLYYAVTITPPLNHLGITQTLLPYAQSVSLGGTVSGN